MRTNSRYDDFDRDAEMTSEARVVNVSPHVARFEIATTPGSHPRRYKLAPGKSVNIEFGYTQPFTGAGRQKVRAPIEALTELAVWAGGPTLPMVVHEDRADEVRRQWQEMIARGAEPPKPIDVMLPSANGGEPVKMTVQPAAAVPMRSAPAPQFDDEDQASGELDEPPPDHNEPLEAVTVPAAAPSKSHKGKH
jgi:hypothetical protein